MSLVAGSALLLSGCQATPAQENDVAARLENAPASLSARAMAESVYEVLVAEIAGQQGDLATAYSLLMRAAQTRQQEDLYQRALQAALQMGDGNRALEAAQAWQKAMPQSREANQTVLQMLLALNRIPQSQWHLRQELRLTPDAEMAENLYAIPLLYQRVPDKQMVLKVVEAALEEFLQPGSPWRGDAVAVLGRIQLQAGDAEGALARMREAFAINPRASGAAFLALELYGGGEVQAGAPLHRYAASEQASPRFLLSYARMLIGQNHSEQALEVLERVTRVNDPALSEAWLAKAALEAGRQDYARARASLDAFEAQLVQLPPSGARQRGLDEANVMRAQLADVEGDHDAARRFIEQIREPEVAARALFQHAQALAGAGRLHEAREAIRSAPALDEDMRHMKVLAEVQLLRDQARYHEAYVLLSALVEASPDDDDLAYELALLAERLGRTAEMEARLRAIIARSPEHHHALNALGYSLADRGERLDEARTLITRALAFEPDSPYILDSLGWLEYREGNLARAIELLQKAYDGDQDAEIAAHLGEVLWQAGQRARARDIWQRAAQAQPDNQTLRETMQRLDASGAAESRRQESQ
ncbi:hypothetical protein AAV94_09770 [Lampropedia cohaerens]|uniref:Tetratricopeptide repeat-like domain-containing protein n=1 Tax=Lampropedia cohaerens TaxID=1610491 RepID=A0A0U1PYI0_9BURK|nr:tetratricopeptide repeat protein [Lampropedia cohaerens]KKW67570.1 hypothetical protein AAV94_09770 [Lampropedia cohaerens]